MSKEKGTVVSAELNKKQRRKLEYIRAIYGLKNINQVLIRIIEDHYQCIQFPGLAHRWRESG